MTRYYIRPVGLKQRSQAWASTLRHSREMKARLQEVTGLKWRITKKEIAYDNSVQRQSRALQHIS